MDFKDVYNREKNAVLYGQSVRFRIIKYIILFGIFTAFYAWRGFNDTLLLLAVLFAASLCIHFFFRYMSEGWTKSWGLYKHTSVDRK